MRYEVTSLRELCPNAYQSLLDASPLATVFHSLEWLRVYEEFSPTTRQYMVCAWHGPDLVAAMPVTVFSRLGAIAVFSSGFSAYGGPVARPDCPQGVVDRVCEVFVRRFLRWHTVMAAVQDFGDVCGSLASHGFRRSPSFTHLINLPHTPGELEGLWPAPAKYRKAMRRVGYAGIRVELAASLQDFEASQKLISSHYVMQGRRPYPQQLYEAIQRLVAEGTNFRLFVAKKDGCVVGALLCVFALRRAFGWWLAVMPQYKAYQVSDALWDAAVRKAIEEGCDYMDMGASPSDRDGIVIFKEKWGGRKREFPTYSRASLIGRLGAHMVRYGMIPRLGQPHGTGTRSVGR
jgi:ribosomal protein S18 acetylase RimI-like enzyme